jgi:hypothetical protein
LKRWLEVGFDEVKEGVQVRVTAVLGLVPSSLGYFVQKRQDLFRTDAIEHAILADVSTGI